MTKMKMVTLLSQRQIDVFQNIWSRASGTVLENKQCSTRDVPLRVLINNNLGLLNFIPDFNFRFYLIDPRMMVLITWLKLKPTERNRDNQRQRVYYISKDNTPSWDNISKHLINTNLRNDLRRFGRRKIKSYVDFGSNYPKILFVNFFLNFGLKFHPVEIPRQPSSCEVRPHFRLLARDA